jgi:hypothetical protein
MNEITEAAADTALAAIESTTRFAEIGDGGEFAVDGATSIPTTIEGIACFLCVLFVFEAHVDVADEICCVSVSKKSIFSRGDDGCQ